MGIIVGDVPMAVGCDTENSPLPIAVAKRERV